MPARGLGDGDEAVQIVERMLLARFLRFGPRRAPEEAQVVAIASGGRPWTRELRPKSEDELASVAMGSSGALDPKVEDDRRHVVQPEAVAYGERVKKVTMSRLVVQGHSGSTSALPLTRDAYTIGRHRNNDIVISDPKVSSFHARIDRRRKATCSSDLKSRNGSYINGKRIETGLLKTGGRGAHGDGAPRVQGGLHGADLLGILETDTPGGHPLPDIRPFRGLRYRLPDADLARVLAPPYDVITPSYQEELYARDPRNIVRVVLSRTPGDAGYDEAGATFAGVGSAAGLLAPDAEPALYLWSRPSTSRADAYRRYGVLARFRAEENARGRVLPHEHTRKAAKEDRWTSCSRRARTSARSS